ncbi:MAG TPA: hypothetical protein VKE40_15755 [Gemmataceae bacterium]|nr:hypothetical protein [Gemmataceae bacterium]
MMSRVLSLALVALAYLAFVGAPAWADEAKTHEGHVVKVAPGKLTMMDKDKKEHTHDVAREAEITLDGKKVALTDLTPHTHVVVTMDDKHAVTKIEAHSAEKK